MRRFRSTSGQSLVLVLAYATLVSIIGISTAKLMSVLNRFERGIASNIDLSTIDSTVRLIVDRSETCAKSGLIGLNITPLLTEEPTPVPVSLHLPGTGGPGPLYLAAGRTVSARRVLSLNLAEAVPIGLRAYFVVLDLLTEVGGHGITNRNPRKRFHLYVQVDDENFVTGCSAQSQAVGTTEISDTIQPTPSPAISTYIEAEVPGDQDMPFYVVSNPSTSPRVFFTQIHQDRLSEFDGTVFTPKKAGVYLVSFNINYQVAQWNTGGCCAEIIVGSKMYAPDCSHPNNGETNACCGALSFTLDLAAGTGVYIKSQQTRISAIPPLPFVPLESRIEGGTLTISRLR